MIEQTMRMVMGVFKKVRRVIARHLPAGVAVLLMPMILPGLPQTSASLTGLSNCCDKCGCGCCKKPAFSGRIANSAPKAHGGCCGSKPVKPESSTHTKCPKKCTSCLAPACNQVNYLPVSVAYSWDEPQPVLLPFSALLPPNSSSVESIFHPPKV
ncbi:MAG: hypothetical protein AABZ47_01250 [Planctomycetota bacterium]